MTAMFNNAFVEMCKKEGIILVSSRTPLTTYLNGMGEEKKHDYAIKTFHDGTPNFPNNTSWLRQKRFCYDPSCPTHLVRTGKESGILVVDFDDATTYNRIVKKYPALKDLLTIKTHKGYHIYGAYTPVVKQTSNLIPQVDIRNQNGCAFAPPTRYSLLDGETTGYSVHIAVDKIKIPFPPEFIDYLVKEQDKKMAKQTKKAKKPEFIQQLRQEAEEQAGGGDKPEFVKKLLAIIKDEYKNNYSDYLKIVIACSKYSSIKKAVRKAMITPQYPKNDITDEAFETAWNSYQGKQTCGLPTICYYAKASDPKKFTELYIELPDTYEASNFGMAAVALSLLDDVVLWDGLRKTDVVLDAETQYWKILEKGDTTCKYMIMDALQTHYTTCLNHLHPKLAALAESDREEDEAEWTKVRGQIHMITSAKEKVETAKVLDDIYKMFRMVLAEQTAKGVEFIPKPHLLPFADGLVLDMEAIEFRRATRDDLITRHTGTIYKEPSEEAVEQMRTEVRKILVDDPNYKTYMSVIVSALWGIMPEKIVFAFGEGRNGKSKFSDLMKAVLGINKKNGNGLAVDGNIMEIMGARQNGGANPELAKLQDKRLVIFGEPEKGKKFNAPQIKLMTGQHSISARALYSNNTHIDLTCSYICELNGLIPFNDSGTSLEDRIVIVRFNSYFTEDPEEYNDPNPPRPTFKADVRMRDWFNKNWCAFVPLLMEHMREMDMSCGIDLRQFETPEMRKDVLDWVSRGNDLYQFIKDNYNLTNNNNDVVRVEEIRTLYKDTFNRKNISADNFIQMIKENNKLKRRWVQDKIVDGTRIRRSLIGITPKYDCDSEEECDGI